MTFYQNEDHIRKKMGPRDYPSNFHEFASGPAHHVVTHLMQMEKDRLTLKNLRLACKGLCSAVDATIDTASVDLSTLDMSGVQLESATKFLRRTSKHMGRLQLHLPDQFVAPLLGSLGPFPVLRELSVTVTLANPDVDLGAIKAVCAPQLAALTLAAVVRTPTESCVDTDNEDGEIVHAASHTTSMQLARALLPVPAVRLRRLNLSNMNLEGLFLGFAEFPALEELHLANNVSIDACALANAAPRLRTMYAHGTKLTWNAVTAGSTSNRRMPHLTSLTLVNCDTTALFEAPRLVKLTLCNVSSLESLHTLSEEMPDLAYCRIAMCQDLVSIESLQRSYERMGAPSTMVVIDSVRHPLHMPLYARGMRFSFICGIVYKDSLVGRLVGLSSIRTTSCLMCHAGGRMAYGNHTGSFDSVQALASHWS